MLFQDNLSDKIVEFCDLDGKIQMDDLYEYREELPKVIRENGEDYNRLLIPYSSFESYATFFIQEDWVQIE